LSVIRATLPSMLYKTGVFSLRIRDPRQILTGNHHIPGSQL
jgi:hypothetical protein